MSKAIAILASDLHLSATPPPARAGEPDWYAAQRRPLQELQKLSLECDAPIIYAGDIFDRWNSSPEVINFAIDNLPRGYSIYGNHDLPNHSPSELHRSAYAVLVKAKVLCDIGGRLLLPDQGLHLFAFPWGSELKPCGDEWRAGYVRLAVVHRYIWTTGHSFPGATDATAIGTYRPLLSGYHAAVFGDNHKGFLAPAGFVVGGSVVGCNIINTGGFMRRKSDEADYRPMVGLLLDDGTIEPYYLDQSRDVFEATTAVKQVETSDEMTAFLQELAVVEQDSLDFREAVRRCLEVRPLTDSVRQRVLAALGG